MTSLPDPISRRERQRQTREALIFAARDVFARDGYHGASLEGIAREAGFSKGAVYSNFEGKAALFLAVMDVNLELAAADVWDPFERAPRGSGGDSGDSLHAELQEAMTGFALATLEFIAAAARDEDVAPQLAIRMQALVGAYTQVATEVRAEGEHMAADDLGALLAALDQGIALLLLSGTVRADQRLLRAGARRLLDPARAATVPDDEDGGFGLHDRQLQERIAAAMREGMERR